MITLDDVGRLPVTMTVPEYGERVLGLSRGSSYAAAHRGDFPTVRLGGRIVVPVAKALAELGITSPESASAEPAQGPASASTHPTTGSQDHDAERTGPTSIVRGL